MAALPCPARVKVHRVYTIWEAALLLGRHKRSVMRWIKDMGLQADTTRKPWLIEGHVLKAFLGAARKDRKQTLALHHCYCLGCRAPREPAGRMADFVMQSSTSGLLSAICPACGAMMHKAMRRSDLEVVRAKVEVTVQPARPRLVSDGIPSVNVTFIPEAATHG